MRAVLVCAFALVTGVATATPIPISALGIAKPVIVLSHPYNVLGGGGFSGTIAGNATTLWCVDLQNTISPGQPSANYLANVIALGPWPSGQNSLVRAGATSNWSDGSALTPLQRYQAAAWLVAQYSGFPAGPDANSAANQAIQNAIWRLLHKVDGGGAAVPAANAAYSNAVSFITNPANSNFGFNNWAVVSGVVSVGGDLLRSRRQTFLVEYQPIPEPSTYALCGLALGATLLARKRGKRS